MITLITDASYCNQTGCAGWAAWAIGEVGRFTWSGPVTRIRCETSGDAEMVAALYGFMAVVRDMPPDDVLLQSDCQRTLEVLRALLGFGDNPYHGGSRTKPYRRTEHGVTACERRVAEAWGVRLRDMPVQVRVRHVKGHTGKGLGGRYWVNRHVDQLAKAEMQKLRDGHARSTVIGGSALEIAATEGMQHA